MLGRLLRFLLRRKQRTGDDQRIIKEILRKLNLTREQRDKVIKDVFDEDKKGDS